MAAQTFTPSSTPQRLSVGELAQRGLLAAVAAIVANLVVRTVLVALLNIESTLLPFQMGPIIVATALGAVAATLVFAFINRRLARPVRTFTWVAVVALILSILPNIQSALNPVSAPFPGATATAMLALIVLHVVAAAVIVPVLTRGLGR